MKEIGRPWRKEAAYREYKAGVPLENIAEHFDLEVETVKTYIRESKQDETGYYGVDGYSLGKPRHQIDKWARDMLGREVMTPDGNMTIAEAYPHILRLYTPEKGYKTYTTAEIFYLNRRTP